MIISISLKKAELAYKKRLKRQQMINKLITKLDPDELQELYDGVCRMLEPFKLEKDNNGH
jgi:hypothetical protein